MTENGKTEKSPCKVTAEIFIPERLLPECLQNLRDFETKHGEAVLVLLQVEGNLPVGRMTEILESIVPPMTDRLALEGEDDEAPN